MEDFLEEPVLPFFGWAENINIRFWNFFCQETSFQNFQKLLKNTVPNTMATDMS